MEKPIEAIISKVTTLADGSIRIYLDTQEQSAHTMADLFDLRKKLGFFFFRETLDSKDELDSIELPKPKATDSPKSPSQRLRSVLYVYWEQTNQSQDFETFYTENMNKFVDHIKSKLD